jgi:HlyD family secretion protein
MDQEAGKRSMAGNPDIAAALSLDKGGRARRNWRRWLGYALVPLLLIGAFYGYQSWTASSAVEKTYTAQPLTKVDVSSEQSGVVREVLFEENDQVKKGDVLATLDTTTLAAQVERAEASVIVSKARIADAKTTLKEADQTLERTKSLTARGTLSQQDLDSAVAKRDRAESAVTSAEADLAVSEAELKVQQSALSKSTIYAPIDGIILTRSVDPGQTVAASLSAPVLFVIAEDLRRMKLEAGIDEADIGIVAEKQKARFSVDAFPGKSFNALISKIAFASQTTENVVTYEAQLDVDNSDLTLRPGMTANVDIITREANGVLTVPNSGFRYQPAAAPKSTGWTLTSLFMPRFPRNTAKETAKPAADGTRTLYVLKDGAPSAVQVKTGSTDGLITEILSGLAEGDLVITAESTAKAG